MHLISRSLFCPLTFQFPHSAAPRWDSPRVRSLNSALSAPFPDHPRHPFGFWNCCRQSKQREEGKCKHDCKDWCDFLLKLHFRSPPSVATSPLPLRVLVGTAIAYHTTQAAESPLLYACFVTSVSSMKERLFKSSALGNNCYPNG